MAYGNIIGQKQNLTDYALKTDLNSYLLLDGGTMSGNINMNNNILSGIPTPTTNDQAVNKGYTDNLNVQQNFIQMPQESQYTFLGSKIINMGNNVSLSSDKEFIIPHIEGATYIYCGVNYIGVDSGNRPYAIVGVGEVNVPNSNTEINFGAYSFAINLLTYKVSGGNLSFLRCNNEYVKFISNSPYPYSKVNLTLSYYKR